jgi:hypothetical protein
MRGGGRWLLTCPLTELAVRVVSTVRAVIWFAVSPAPLGERLVTTPQKVGSAIHQRRLRPVLDTHHPIEHGQPSMRGGGEALLT